jgi:hypothetical protein
MYVNFGHHAYSKWTNRLFEYKLSKLEIKNEISNL